MTTILIIGAGFSGASLAANLAEHNSGRVRIAMLDASGRFGRGVAYGTSYAEHLLNVPAGNMSALPDDPDHFVRWARERVASVTGGSFLPRKLFGEYLGQRVERAAGMPGAHLDLIHALAIAAKPRADGGFSVELQGRGVLEADRLVLATGNPPPAELPLQDRRALASERFITDPWAEGALERLTDAGDVLLIGTGLTMLDVALVASRKARGRIMALSRHGLLPKPHRTTARPPSPYPFDPPLERWPHTAHGILHALRAEVRRAKEKGINWRDVVASLRPATPQLWQSLNLEEQSRFLRHLRCYWDSHRHRAAPPTAAGIDELLDSQRLSVLAARIVDMQDTGGEMRVTVRRRHSTETASLSVSTVVNCTGPTTDIRRLNDPLLRSLLREGVIQPDALGLGILTDSLGGAINAAGIASDRVFIAGPARRAQLWEHTAVPELRVASRDLAAHLLNGL